MSSLLPFVILGLVSGSVYGMAGTGLVLTYKTSGILNFAQGALGAVGAYVFYFLRTDHGMPWPIAFFISVFLLGPVMGLALELLARRLAQHGAAVKVVGTLGIVLAVEAGAFLWYDSGYQLFPAYLPKDRHHLGGVTVGTDQIIIFAISLVCVIGLYLMLRLTRAGIAMRAVVDSPDLVSLQGISPTRVRRSAWIIGTSFACLAGVLLGPTITLNAALLTLLVMQAFGAAVIGRFQNLLITYVGGLVIGVAGSISTKYSLNIPWLSGLPASIPFIVLFVGLLVTPKHILAERWATRSKPLPRPWQAPPKVRITAGVIALIFFVVLPSFAGTRQFAVTQWLIFALIFLSLGLLVKMSGQVSLCHFGLAAVGAASFGQFLRHGMPWGVALLLAALVAVPAGAIVAFSAIRLSGIFLAVATYGFAILLQQLLYNTSFMFQPTLGAGLTIPRPGVSWLDSDRKFYYLVLAIVVVVAVGLALLERGRFGRLLRALSDSQLALETHGTTASVLKLTVFCLSSFIAGLAGALLGGLYGIVDGQEFSPFASLSVFVLVMLIFGGLPWYALVGGATLTIVPTILTFGHINNYLSVLFGVGAITLVYQMDNPPGLPSWLRGLFDRGRHTGSQAFAQLPPIDDVDPLDRAVVRPDHGGLVVSDLVVRYGGVVAVDGLSLSAPVGTITGLIGPNGAGKTTTFNATSGTVKPRSGQICFDGTDITDMAVAARARLGLGRTFQRVELWESLTVLENVAMGSEAHQVGGKALAQLKGNRREMRAVARSAREAIELTGIEDLCDTVVSALSTGQRRLVELTRCLAGSFDMLLLDEPSSGLDTGETERFGAVLKKVVNDRGVGILLVEHDMSLVMDVCQYIYVLDFGRPLFEGTPAEVASSPVVRAAYLGAEIVTPTAKGRHLQVVSE